MNRILLRAWFGVFVFACVLGLALSRHSAMTPVMAVTPSPTPVPLPYASATPTPASPSLTGPGQTITNAASATYSDGTNTYNILSNTVTVYVQNAPTLVVLTNNGTSVGSNTTRYPGVYTYDLYTLVNTGNGTGYFTVASGPQASPTPLPATNSGTGTTGTVTNVSYDVSCSGGATLNDIVTTIAALNTDLQNAACSVASNGSVSIEVVLDPTAAPASDGSTLEAQITYSTSGTGYNAASSLYASNSYVDPVVTDERIDVQKSPAPIATDGTVTYAVTANNAGNGPAQYVTDYGTTCTGTVTVCGPALTGPGLLIADKIPLNASNTPLPVVTMSPSPGPQALPPSTTVSVVYTTDSTAKTGWTVKTAATFPPTTRYVGVFLTGGAYALGADPTPAATTTPGFVPAASSQIGFSVTLGPLPANLTVSNIVTAAAGDNKTTPCIEGPGLVTTSTSCDPNGPNGPGGDPSIPLATAPPSPSAPGPGLSNTTTTFTPALYNGPLTAPDAQGCFNSSAAPVPLPTWSPMPNPFPTISPTTSPTCAATDNQDDFTQAVSTPNPSTTNMPYGTQMSAASTVTVANSIKNPGAQSTVYQLTFPTLPAGITVTSVTYGAASCSTTSTPASGVYPLGSIGAGATIQYCVLYTTATGASAPYYFQPQFVQLRVAYSSAPAVYYNDTWNVLMPGGFVEIVKTANILTALPAISNFSGNCSGTITGGLPTLGVCPGGIIQYAVAYVNTLPPTSSGTPAEPAGASVAMTGNLVITEDGAVNGSNWTTYTGGMFDPAGAGTVPLVAGLSLSTLSANCGIVTLKCGATSASATFGGGASPNGNLYGSTHFTATIPAAGITAQSVGTLMFAAKVH
ncbi:MAG: hypothetical protein ABR508_07450 [Candidatus Baltobacteraceae bacterium]